MEGKGNQRDLGKGSRQEARLAGLATLLEVWAADRGEQLGTHAQGVWQPWSHQLTAPGDSALQVAVIATEWNPLFPHSPQSVLPSFTYIPQIVPTTFFLQAPHWALGYGHESDAKRTKTKQNKCTYRIF